MVAYLPTPVWSIEARPNDKRSDYMVIDRMKKHKWVYLMTYQAKLIEEGSW